MTKNAGFGVVGTEIHESKLRWINSEVSVWLQKSGDHRRRRSDWLSLGLISALSPLDAE